MKSVRYDKLKAGERFMCSIICCLMSLLFSCGFNDGVENLRMNVAETPVELPGSSMVIFSRDPSSTGEGELDLQARIDASSEGDTIWVAPGTYFGNFDFHGKAVVVKSAEGPEKTVLDGNWSGSVVRFRSREDTTSVLDGFTVTHGSGTGEAWHECGGGIYIDDSSPKIVNNVIVDNSLPEPLSDSRTGGAIYINEGKAVIIRKNKLLRNIAGLGGGILIYSSGVTITGNIIVENEAGSLLDGGEGGGIRISGSIKICNIAENIFAYNRAHASGTQHGTSGGGLFTLCYGDLEVSHPLFVGNEASHGGGIRVFAGDAAIVRNVFYRNRSLGMEWCGEPSGGRGGAISQNIMASMIDIYGNTIVENEACDKFGAEGLGGGIYSSNCWQRIVNNIVVNNVNGGICWKDGDDGEIRYNDVWGNTGGDYQMYAHPGEGCISVDPQFVGHGREGYRLEKSSPCINAGIDLGYPFCQSDPEMGAWEYCPNRIDDIDTALKLMLDMMEDVPDSVR